jgi:hypothetical protein
MVSGKPDIWILADMLKESHIHPGAELVPLPVRRHKFPFQPDPLFFHMYQYTPVAFGFA